MQKFRLENYNCNQYQNLHDAVTITKNIESSQLC